MAIALRVNKISHPVELSSPRPKKGHVSTYVTHYRCSFYQQNIPVKLRQPTNMNGIALEH